MPLAADPSQTLPVQLKSDAALPEAYRATFYYRALTVSQHRRRASLLESAQASEDLDEIRRLLNQAVTLGLAGWKNLVNPETGLHIPFPGIAVSLSQGQSAVEQAFDDALTPDEKWDLAYETGAAVRLAVADKKKSALPATSAPASSATNATANA